MGRLRTWIRGSKMGRATTLVALLCVLGNGCSTDDTSSGEAVANWCSAYCAWRAACGEGPSVTCASGCRLSGGFAGYGRLEFYVSMTSCLQRDSSCSGGLDAAWGACYEEASLQTTLTQAAFDFCESMGELFFECGYGGSPVSCARGYISLTDEVLEDATVCRNQSCDTYSDCISTVAFGGT